MSDTILLVFGLSLIAAALVIFLLALRNRR